MRGLCDPGGAGRLNRVALIAAGVVASCGLGCGASPSPDTTSTPDPSEIVDRSAAPESRGVAATNYPDGEWPLSAKYGTVRCDGGSVIFRSRSGKDYAVNGTALTQHPEMARIREIWLPNPDIPGTKVNISPVLDAGLNLC
jgi:hypothetical protein